MFCLLFTFAHTKSMNMKTDPNHSVYPDPMRGAESSIINQSPHCLPEGLTIRQYYAGLAMQGLYSNPETFTKQTLEYAKGKSLGEYLAEQSVCAADALIAELNKEQ